MLSMRHNKGPRVFGVILVGGKGKRLRPLSTDSKPKPFLRITKDRRTMFARTVRRLAKVVPAKNILVVANKAHASLIRKDFPGIEKNNLLLEPVARNTGPAIALAGLALKKRSEDAVMVVLPADHYIADEDGYVKSIKKGINFVADNEDAIVALAIKPEYPATGYGYLKIQGSGAGSKKIYKVEKFVEKPDSKKAGQFFNDRRYLWNTGVFVFKTKTILKNIERFFPAITDSLRSSGGIEKVYRRLPNISIDYAVMERSHDIYCVKGSYRWQDIGSFESLKDVLMREAIGYTIRKGRIVTIL